MCVFCRGNPLSLSHCHLFSPLFSLTPGDNRGRKENEAARKKGINLKQNIHGRNRGESLKKGKARLKREVGPNTEQHWPLSRGMIPTIVAFRCVWPLCRPSFSLLPLSCSLVGSPIHHPKCGKTHSGGDSTGNKWTLDARVTSSRKRRENCFFVSSRGVVIIMMNIVQGDKGEKITCCIRILHTLHIRRASTFSTTAQRYSM